MLDGRHHLVNIPFLPHGGLHELSKTKFYKTIGPFFIENEYRKTISNQCNRKDIKVKSLATIDIIVRIV